MNGVSITIRAHPHGRKMSTSGDTPLRGTTGPFSFYPKTAVSRLRRFQSWISSGTGIRHITNPASALSRIDWNDWNSVGAD